MPENTKNNILIVEDDEMVRSFVTIHLETNGFRVSGVSTGKAFFAAMEKEPVDLIILDLNLPDGDGLEFAAELRKKDNTPIIIASARKGLDDRLTALNMGSIDYLTKPFDPQELLLRIKNLLNLASQETLQPAIKEVESSPNEAQKKYAILGAVAVIVIIGAAGLGWYFGQITPQETADNITPPKNITAKQETPPSQPPVQTPPPNPSRQSVQPTRIIEPSPYNEPITKPIKKASPPPTKQIVARTCNEIPQVDWWSNKSHRAVQNYVQRKYSGNWAPYIKSWTGRREKLVDILQRNSKAVTSSGIVISGKELEEYISNVEKRINILKCLAAES